MAYVYSDDFFDYIEQGAMRSARNVVRTLMPLLRVQSVLDVGCGRGAWLRVWSEEGVQKILGIDGSYVEPAKLLIPRECFMPKNLSEPFDVGTQFDLVQSLEVAEHLREEAAADFVKSIVAHGNVVLFSAAVVGQGGENHVNEQPLEYWRRHFRDAGYEAFDAVRPLIRDLTSVEPWYRFNTVIYADAAGERRLPPEIRARRLSSDQTLRESGNAAWRIRCAIVARLPDWAVRSIATVNARRVARRYRKAQKVTA